MIIPRFFAAGVLLLFAVSCASYAPRVAPSFVPGPGTTVAYGRFKFVDNVTAREDSSWAYRMSLQFLNEDTKRQVSVRFSKNDPVSCVRLQPGHYKLTGFVATDGAGQKMGGKQLVPEDRIAIEFNAETNAAIYLGDFSGYAKFRDFGELRIFETGLRQVTNNFPETTAVFREKYPHLQALPLRSAFGPATGAGASQP